MGNAIKQHVQGMRPWAKGCLVAVFTLLVCAVMYYKPFIVQAVSKQYVLQPSAVTFTTGGTTVNGNTICSTDITTQNNIYELVSPGPSTCTSTDISYQIPQTNGTTWVEGIYNTAYGQSTTVTGTSFLIPAGDDGNAGTFTFGVQLFYLNPATGVKTNIGSQVNTTTTQVAVTAYTVSLSGVSGTVPAGSKLGVRVIYVGPGAVAPQVPRIAVGSSTAYASAGGVLVVDELAADTTAPTVTAFTMPATATSTTVSVTSFTASDNVGVTGYLITESATAPAAGAAGWAATAPTSYTFAGSGSRTAYAWAKDAAGNVSAGVSATVTITLPDTTAPTVTAFTMPATATALTVPVTTFTASDNVGVTGYLITESATAPAAGAAGWSATAPSSYTFSAAGARTAYAWAKDAAGNVSAGASANVTITLPDTTAPTLSAFTMPSTASSLTVAITAFTATDNVGVTGWMVKENNTTPAAGDAGWLASAPSTFTFAAEGLRTAYAWVRDAAGNISNMLSAAVTITLPDTTAPTVTAFTMPSTATSLTVAVTSFTATDNKGVTGYLITESATAPAAGAAGWSATAPASYTFSATGARTAYAWAKDAAGNVSASVSASVTITPADSIAPTVTAFAMPATANSRTVSITTFTATDNVGVAGYLVTESAAAPSAGAAGWSATAPASYTFSTPGTVTAYAWAKDAAGNVSASMSATVVVTAPAVNPLMHSSDNLGTKYGTWGTTFTCATCHNRNTTNVKRVDTTVQTPTGPRPVVFLRMTSSIDTTGIFGDDLRATNVNGSQNICEVCHHKTTHHQYSSAKITDRTTNPHYNRQDCASSCHLHSAGFKGAGCDGCHGNPPITANIGGGALNGLASPATGATSPASPGAHAVHVNTEGMRCATCHSGSTMPTVSNSIQMGFVVSNANWATHIAAGSYAFGSFSGHAPLNAPYTGFVSSNAGTLVSTSAGYRDSCNVYCHGNWAGNNGSLNPSWVGGPSQAACGTCHGASAANPPQTGSHATHAGNGKYAFSCTKCHPNAASGAGVNFAHIDGSVQWRLSSSASGVINTGATYRSAASGATGSFAPSATYGQCASLYCHSNGQATPIYASVTWGASLPADCSGCHGNAISDTLSGKHRQHLNPATNATLGLGNGFGCVECHTKTVSSNTTISDRTKHVNNFIDYSGVRAGGSARYSTTTKNCTNIYCHSNGNPGALVYVNPAAWNSTTAYGCNGCHGTSNTTTGAPDYANGGAGTTTANSHQKHVAGAGITDTRGCANCHVKTASQSTAGAFKDYSASKYHLNGGPNIIFKQIGGSTGTWNGSTCSNTYCHGATASAAWGSPSLACNACHAANSALPGAHGIHYASTVLPSKFVNFSGNVSTTAAYRFTCSSCHASGTGKATHAGGPATATGAAEVFFGFTTNTQKGSYTYGTTQGADNGFNWTNGGAGCNTSYCHSNGQGGNGLAAVAWSTTASTGTCVQCHDTKQTGATATGLSGKHNAHMNPTSNVSLGLGNGFNCVDCHAKTVSTNTSLRDKSKHVNKFIDYSGVRAGGSARYSTASKSCSNIYCHSNGNPGALVYVNMTGSKTWTGSATLGCNGCHGRSSTIGAPDYANGGAAPSTTANSHGKHVSGAVDTTICSNCHLKTANLTVGGKFKDYTAASYHLNGTPNIYFNTAKAGTTATWTQSSGTCNNVTCHGGTGSSAVWGSTLNCQDCHGNGATASVADFGTTFWNNGTISKFQMTGTGSWAGNGHGLATGTYAGSGNPAANFGVVTNQCEFCHDPSVGHSLASNPFRLKNYSTAAYGRNAPCLICHSASGAGITIGTTTKKRTTSKAIEADHYGTKHTAALNGGQFCWDCHDPHGTGNSNQYMVRANPAQVSNSATSAPTTQTATAVVFTLSATPTGTDYAKSAAPFNGICNVCHTTTSHYTQTAGDSHNSGTRCTSCHGHTGSIHGSDAFKPTGGHSVPYDTHYVDVRASGNSTCLGCHVMGTTSSVYPAAVAGNAPDCMGCHKKAAPVTTGTGAGANCSSCHGVSTATTANYGRPVGTAFPDRQGYHGGAQDTNHGTAACSTCHSGLGTLSGSGSGVNHGRGSTTGPVRDGKPDIVGPMVNGITPTNGTKGVSNTPVTCNHGTISSGCSGGGTQSGW